MGYAQKVPEASTNYEEMDFAIIFLVQESVMYGFQDYLITKIDETKYWTAIGIVGCLSLFFAIIAIIVLAFSRQITKPVGALTRFTKQLK